MLRIESARKTYGTSASGAPALDGCSLHVREKEWVGLLGPNGAGKTTLIRAISGRVRLDAGAITLFGQPLTGERAHDDAVRRDLGVVPQEIALYPALTARENLEVFAGLRGLQGGPLRDRVAWALDFTGLAERADDRVSTYSGGMKRRLNIACGVLHRPRLVLLDEPTVGVDPQSRQRIWEMLAALRDEGASLLLTTHQLDEAQQLCDRIVIIDHGRTIADGAVGELVAATVGRGHEVRLRLDAPLPDGAVIDGTRGPGAELTVRLDDVASELPALLTKVAAAGRNVDDLQVLAPSLHSVFLALTGRELRE